VVFQEIKCRVAIQSLIHSLDIYSKEFRARTMRDTCTTMFIAALFARKT
jgi:hypothetical protein